MPDSSSKSNKFLGATQTLTLLFDQKLIHFKKLLIIINKMIILIITIIIILLIIINKMHSITNIVKRHSVNMLLNFMFLYKMLVSCQYGDVHIATKGITDFKYNVIYLESLYIKL